VPNLVTNGPFCIESWDQAGEQEGTLVLKRNPRYYGRRTGNVDQVALIARPEDTGRLAAYEAGEWGMLSFRQLSQDRDRIRQRHADEYLSVPFLATSYAVFDVNQPPLDDPRVRRALVHALDRERHADVVLNGWAFPATGGFVPPGMPGHSSGIGLPHDPSLARRLLAEAGYNDGLDLSGIEFVIGPGQEPTADYMVTQWRENLGIALSWQTMGWEELLGRFETAPPSILLYVWMSDYPDPDNFMRASNAVRWARWQDRDYRQLVEDARRVMDQDQRIDMYRRADRILVEAAAILPLTYWRSHFLIKPWIKRFPTSAIKWWYWKDVVIKPQD
jgi:ABC-type oligopeptide transport system substrate-binding subunit